MEYRQGPAFMTTKHMFNDAGAAEGRQLWYGTCSTYIAEDLQQLRRHIALQGHKQVHIEKLSMRATQC